MIEYLSWALVGVYVAFMLNAIRAFEEDNFHSTSSKWTGFFILTFLGLGVLALALKGLHAI